MHAPGASGLLSGSSRQRATKTHHGAGDLVAEGDLALVMMAGSSAVVTGGASCGCCGSGGASWDIFVSLMC